MQHPAYFMFPVLASVGYMLMGQGSATSTQIIAKPPAEVYAEYDALYGTIERYAVTATPVTGSPPTPVKLTFEKDAGRMRGLTATGDLKTARIKIRVTEGDTPNETKLRVSVWPSTMLDRTGMGDVHGSAIAVLRRTASQMGTKAELPALFGSSYRNTADYSSQWSSDRPYVSTGSTRPMVDPTPSRY